MVTNNYIFDRLKESIVIQDSEFDRVYQDSIKVLSYMHWTPVNVAMKAAELLVESPETKVLDIGSGSGKFCLVGASSSDGFFTGVEQREFLVNMSKTIAQQYDITNTDFIHSNIMDIDFANYDSFYFFNSFCENIINIAPKIDDSVDVSFETYDKYTAYVRNELAKLKSGTRVVTYCSEDIEIPKNYLLKEVYFDDSMKLWVKN